MKRRISKNQVKGSLTFFFVIFLNMVCFGQSVYTWSLDNNLKGYGPVSINGTGIVTYSSTIKKTGISSLDGGIVDLGNPSLPSGNAPRSISLWMRTNTTTGIHTAIAYGTAAANQSMFIGQSGTSLIAGAYGSGNYITVANFWAPYVWHHIVLTYDGSTATLYADGIQISSAAKTWNLITSKFYFGQNVDASELWNGNIDDVRLYNYSITAQQVYQDVLEGTRLVAHWNMEQSVFGGPLNCSAVNNPTFSIDSKENDYSLNLNGVNQFVDGGNASSLPSGTTERTISVWAKTTTVATGQRVIFAYGSATNNQSMFIGQNGTSLVAGAFGAGNYFTVSGFWAVNVWHHISLTYDGQVAKVYADGNLVASGNKTWSLVSSKTYVGRNVNDTEYWNGNIDGLYIFSSCMIQQEVQNKYSQTPSAPPTNLVATTVSHTQINLSWSDNSNNEGQFELWRSRVSGSEYQKVSVLSIGQNQTSCIDNSVTEGTTYYYLLRAKNLTNSAFTNEANATSLAAPPTSLKVAATTSNRVYLNWIDNSANETGYRIERSATSGSNYVLIGTVLPNQTSFVDAALSPSTSYYYRVNATCSAGSSTYSNEISGLTISTANESALKNVASNFSFRYEYDARGRMISKKVPGRDPVYMVYDNRDRVVMTQDGNQRSTPKKYWTFTKFDDLNRPILTGIKEMTRNATQVQMQASVDSFYTIANAKFSEEYVGNATGNMHGYSNVSWPTTTLGSTADANQYLTVTYYDRYDFRSLWAGSYVYQNDALSHTVNGNTYTQPATENLGTNGQVTGTKVKVLDGVSTWLKSVTYYDDSYRIVQMISDNYKGGQDRVSTLYNFAGNALKSRSVHATTSGTNIINRRMESDHAGRVNDIYHQLNSGPEVLLVHNQYNELGQLVDKGLHSEGGAPAKQSVDYRYNIRGWLTSINDVNVTEAGDLFGMNLNYNTPTTNGGAAQYNGNISEILWKSADGQNQSYGYTYDPMNRLVEGKYYNTTNTAKNNRFNEKIWDVAQNKSGYDLNGNIKYLQRQGKTGEVSGVTTYGQMDNMTYTYSGNQLMKVTDAAVKTEGFLDGANTDDDYAYDINGNMFADKNKSITAATTANGSSKITYNHLNLVDKVVKSTGEYVKYIYDATGRKLSQIVYTASNVQQKRSDYAGEFFYEDNVLKFINHEEGRIIPAGNEYQYHIKDHLGNVRVTFTTKDVTEAPQATLEPANATVETANFLRTSNARKVQYFAFDHTNGNSPTTTTGYAERLSGGTNEKYGLARSVSVMPGDKITAEVYAKYIDPVSGNRTSALNTFLGQVTSLIAAGTTSSGTVVDGGSFSSSTSSFQFPTQAASNTAGSTGAGPKAYLNWLVFDRDYNLISSKSGYKRISVTPKETGQDVAHELLFSPEITVDVAGYVYVFLSNEEATPVDVYFDDFKVTQVKSPVVQMDDYYPFGLTFNSFSRENSVKQDFKYNGKEMQDELNLAWLDYGARMYMADVGRWGVLDPLAEKMRRWSPYNYCFDNPLRFIDPDGMGPVWIKGTDGNAVTYNKSADGTVVWSANASTDVQRVGNAMLTTTGGTDNLNTMINAAHPISIDISEGQGPDAQATTIVTAGDPNSNGEPTFGEAEITIYEGTLKDQIAVAKDTGFAIPMGPGGDRARLAEKVYKDGSLEDVIGIVATHEAVHATDPKSATALGAEDPEKLPQQEEVEVMKEVLKRLEETK